MGPRRSDESGETIGIALCRCIRRARSRQNDRTVVCIPTRGFVHGEQTESVAEMVAFTKNATFCQITGDTAHSKR